MNTLVSKILANKQSVREIIDEAVVKNEATSVALGEPESDENVQTQPEVSDDSEYRHLFVRRWHEGEEKPYKRVKMENAMEAINLYFSWLDHYKKDKVEIWSDVAQDAKNFYRFCVKNREMLENFWKNSLRSKKSNIWTAAYRDIQARARQSGSNTLGTLYPFSQEGK